MRNKLLRILLIVVVCFVLAFLFVGCKKQSSNEEKPPRSIEQGQRVVPSVDSDLPPIDDLDPMQGQPKK